MTVLPLIFLTVILNALAQIGLRLGARGLEFGEMTPSTILSVVCRLCQNPYMLGASFLYGVSLLAWIVVLSKAEVSYAYPLSTSLAFVLTTLVGYFFLQENVSFTRLGGILTIMIGVYIVARS